MLTNFIFLSKLPSQFGLKLCNFGLLPDSEGEKIALIKPNRENN